MSMVPLPHNIGCPVIMIVTGGADMDIRLRSLGEGLYKVYYNGRSVGLQKDDSILKALELIKRRADLGIIKIDPEDKAKIDEIIKPS